MNQTTNLTRRRLLSTTASSLAVAGLAPGLSVAQNTPAPAATAPAVPAAKALPAYVSWKNAESMIIHTPTTIETKRSAFGTSIITPADRLYIRNNFPRQRLRSSVIRMTGKSPLKA